MMGTYSKTEKNGIFTATHWNNNLVCAIDVETTGTDPTKHDIIQIAVVPLKSDLTVNTSLMPFEYFIAPNPDNLKYVDKRAMRANKLDIDHLTATAMDDMRVADLFDEWFQKLRLPYSKKIIPLAHNFPFEHSFLNSWLGQLSYDAFFFGYRDTMSVINHLNDIADMHNEPWPFAKQNLAWMCSTLGVTNHRAHDAMSDA